MLHLVGLTLLLAFGTPDTTVPGASTAASSPATITVTSNDATDTYEVSGAVLLASDPAPVQAATCTSCQWRFVHVCATGGIEDRAGCRDAPCLTRDAIVEVWRAYAVTPPPIGDPAWEYRGLACLAQPPIVVAPVTALVREFAERAVPAAAIRTAPAGTTLTGLPTRFIPGQADLVTDAVIAGLPVHLHASPTWVWDSGDGSTTAGATHVFRRRGLYRIRLETRWSATFDAGGVQGIPLGAPITQTASLDLRVREARGFRHTRGA